MEHEQADDEVLMEALRVDHRQRERIVQRLDELGGLAGLWVAGGPGMTDVLSQDECAQLTAMCTFAERLLCSPRLPAEIDSAQAVADYFRPRLALQAAESFWVLMLDARGRPIGTRCVALGTLTACLVHPREVFAPALRMRAASIIVVHNHPSGDPVPSDEDARLTERLARAGEVLGIPLIDHVVVARGGHRSIGTGDPSDTPFCTTRVTSARA